MTKTISTRCVELNFDKSHAARLTAKFGSELDSPTPQVCAFESLRQKETETCFARESADPWPAEPLTRPGVRVFRTCGVAFLGRVVE